MFCFNYNNRIFFPNKKNLPNQGNQIKSKYRLNLEANFQELFFGKKRLSLKGKTCFEESFLFFPVKMKLLKKIVSNKENGLIKL